MDRSPYDGRQFRGLHALGVLVRVLRESHPDSGGQPSLSAGESGLPGHHCMPHQQEHVLQGSRGYGGVSYPRQHFVPHQQECVL